MAVKLSTVDPKDMKYLRTMGEELAFDIETEFALAGKSYNEENMARFLENVDERNLGGCLFAFLFLYPFLKHRYHPKGNDVTDEKFINFLLDIIKKNRKKLPTSDLWKLEVMRLKNCYEKTGKQYPKALTRYMKKITKCTLKECVITVLACNPEFRKIYPTKGRNLSEEKFIDHLVKMAKRIHKYKK